MSNIGNQLNKRNIHDYKNKNLNENLTKPFDAKMNDINKYFPTKVKSDRNKNNNKNYFENLTYKSIFPKRKRMTKNISTNNENRIETNYYNGSINENIFSSRNPENRRNKQESNYFIYLKKKNNSLQKATQIRNQFYIPKEDYNFLNFSEIKEKEYNNLINNDINDRKNYLNYKKYNKLSLKTNESAKFDINNINALRANLKSNNYIKTQRNELPPKIEEKFIKIIDKNDFIKNIKEIDDLNYLDDIETKNNEYLSMVENINKLNFNGKNYTYSTDRLMKGFNSFSNNQIDTKTSNTSILNNNQVNNIIIDTNENFSNNNYNINEKNENNSKRKYKSRLINDLKRNEKKVLPQMNKSYVNKLVVNHNRINDVDNSDNYLLSKETNRFSTMSQMDEKLKSFSKNVSMEFKELVLNNSKLNSKDKANKSNNISNKYLGNIDENIYKKNIETNQTNNVITKLKEKIRQLNNVIVNQNKKINNFIKIIKENKEKNEKLVKNNISLNEENKKIKVLAIKLRNQLNVFKNLKTQNNLNNKDFSENNVNINYNYITNNDKMQTKIKELEQQIEKYKKENNDLKFLLNKYKNNNDEGRNTKENLLNKFNTSYQVYDNHRKASYSVSKSKRNISSSFFSSKVFKEDEM